MNTKRIETISNELGTMLNPMSISPSKNYMISHINTILNRWYGCGTTLSASVQNLPKQAIRSIYYIAWLNRNDPMGEQIELLNTWIENAKIGMYFTSK